MSISVAPVNDDICLLLSEVNADGNRAKHFRLELCLHRVLRETAGKYRV